jgi:hypothetical protein
MSEPLKKQIISSLKMICIIFFIGWIVINIEVYSFNGFLWWFPILSLLFGGSFCSAIVFGVLYMIKIHEGGR